MLHQPEKERQVLRHHPAFVKRQDEHPPLGLQQVVRILDSLGYSLAGEDAADVIGGHERLERIIGDIGIDSHVAGGGWVRP